MQASPGHRGALGVHGEEDLSDGGGRQRPPTDLLESTEPGSPSSGPPPEPGASIPPRGGPYLSGRPRAALEAPIS